MCSHQEEDSDFYTDDEYEWECQCGCGKEVQFTRGCMNGTVIQLYEMEYWLKDCAIKQLGIDTDICTECYERPCVGRCIGCIPDPPEVQEKYDHKGNLNWTNEEEQKQYYINLLKEDDKKKAKLKKNIKKNKK